MVTPLGVLQDLPGFRKPLQPPKGLGPGQQGRQSQLFFRLIQQEVAAAQLQKPGQGQGRGVEVVAAETGLAQVIPGQAVIRIPLHHLSELPQCPGQVIRPVQDESRQQPGMAGNFRVLGLQPGGGQHHLHLAPGFFQLPGIEMVPGQMIPKIEILRPLLEVGQKIGEVAPGLCLAEFPGFVAPVVNVQRRDDLGQVRGMAELLMHPVAETDLRPAGEEPFLQEAAAARLQNFRSPKNRVLGPLHQGFKEGRILFGHAVVPVQPHDPIPRGLLQGEVPGGREIMAPGKVEHPGPQAGGQLRSAVVGAGIHHHRLVHKRDQRGQAPVQVPGFVLNDHAEA